jgi:hypothetical protein
MVVRRSFGTWGGIASAGLATVLTLLVVGCSGGSGAKPTGDGGGGGGATGGNGSAGSGGGGNGLAGASGAAGSGGGVGGATGAAGSTSAAGAGGSMITADAGGPDAAKDAADAGVADAGLVGDGAAVKRANLPGPADSSFHALTPVATDLPGSARGLTADGAGNVYLLLPNTPSGQRIVKLDTTWQVAWSAPLAPVLMTAVPTTTAGTAVDIAATPAGEVFFAGQTNTAAALAGETTLGGTDLLLGHVTAAGQPDWAHQFGGAFNENGLFVRVTGDGSPIIFGTATGQLPAQPSTASGGPFAINYSAAGVRGWTRQLPGLNARAFFDVTVDGSGNSFGLSAGSSVGAPVVFRVNADGTVGWTGNSFAPVPVTSTGGETFHVAAAPGGGFFTLHGYSPACVLTRWDANGSPMWYRLSAEHNVVIDAVENVIWRGRFLSCDGIKVTSDAVYIAGSFENYFMNGSVPRPSTSPIYVGRYDLEGNQAWFTMLDLRGGTFFRFVVDGHGDPIVSGWVTPGNRTDVHRLRAADGVLAN